MVLLGIALVAEILFLSQIADLFPRSNFLANIISSAIIDGTNENRQENNLNNLKQNSVLELAAKAKAEDMASKGYFAHNSPDGQTPWYWLKNAGYNYAYGGENLAINFFDSKDVIDAWMRSPAHKANILNENFTEIGIATAEGIYDGKHAVFVVQYFGTPREAPTTLTETPANIPTSQPNPNSPAPIKIVPADINTPTFVAVKGETVKEKEPAQENENLNKGEIITPIVHVLASPRQGANTLHAFIGGLIALSLILSLLFSRRLKHPKILWRGVLLVAVIVILIAFNKEISTFYSLII